MRDVRRSRVSRSSLAAGDLHCAIVPTRAPAIDPRLEPFRQNIDPFTFWHRAVKVGLVCRKRAHSEASSVDAPDFSCCAPARSKVGYSAKVRLTDGFRFALPLEAFADGRVNAISRDDHIELLVALIGE